MSDQKNKYVAKRKTIDLKWIGVDLDDTIARSIWPEEGIGEVLAGTRDALYELVKKGFKVYIFTARPWNDFEAIERFCKDHDLPVRGIIGGKPLFRWIIDDKAISFDGDWKKTMKEIHKKERGLYGKKGNKRNN